MQQVSAAEGVMRTVPSSGAGRLGPVARVPLSQDPSCSRSGDQSDSGEEPSLAAGIASSGRPHQAARGLLIATDDTPPGLLQHATRGAPVSGILVVSSDTPPGMLQQAARGTHDILVGDTLPGRPQ